MYEPLYRFGDKGSATVDYRLSIGNAPLYSDGNRVVTITLKGERWSDEQAVSARDVIFWINLLKANRDEWPPMCPVVSLTTSSLRRPSTRRPSACG